MAVRLVAVATGARVAVTSVEAGAILACTVACTAAAMRVATPGVAGAEVETPLLVLGSREQPVIMSSSRPAAANRQSRRMPGPVLPPRVSCISGVPPQLLAHAQAAAPRLNGAAPGAMDQGNGGEPGLAAPAA